MDIEPLSNPIPKRNPDMPLQSEQLNELFTALAKAQGEFRVAGNKSENPFFKTRYADLEELVSASRHALSKYGLSVIQRELPDEDGATYLYTILCHSSGQYMSSKMRLLPVKNDHQSKGSAQTYTQRQGYKAMTGVVSADEDDDGERAMADVRESSSKGVALNTKYNPKDQLRDTITREQLDELEYELNEHPDIAEQVLDGLKIMGLADMPKSKFLASINRIRTIKAARNGK